MLTAFSGLLLPQFCATRTLWDEIVELAKTAVEDDQVLLQCEGIIKALSDLSLAVTTAACENETLPQSVEKLRQLVLLCKKPLLYLQACKDSKLDGAQEVCEKLHASIQVIHTLVGSSALKVGDKEFANHLESAWHGAPGALQLYSKDAPAAMKCFWKTWIQGQDPVVVSSVVRSWARSGWFSNPILQNRL